MPEIKLLKRHASGGGTKQLEAGDTFSLQHLGAILAAIGGFTYAKGDIIVYDSNAGALINLGAGTNGQVLTADDALDHGVKWATPVSSPSATLTANNGEAGAITLGQPVYMAADGDVNLCLADSWDTSKFLGVVQDASVAAGNPAAIQLDGTIDFGSTGAVDTLCGTSGGFTPGKLYVLDPNNAGQYLEDADSVTDAGDVVCPALLGVTDQIARIVVDASRIELS